MNNTTLIIIGIIVIILCCCYCYCSLSVGGALYYVNSSSSSTTTSPVTSVVPVTTVAPVAPPDNCPQTIKSNTYVTLNGLTYYVNEKFKLVPVVKTGEAVLTPWSNITTTAINKDCFDSFILTTGCTFPPKNNLLLQSGAGLRYRIVNNSKQKLSLDQCYFGGGQVSCTGGASGWSAASVQCINDIGSGMYDAT
jgi:hypothetical protein